MTKVIIADLDPIVVKKLEKQAVLRGLEIADYLTRFQTLFDLSNPLWIFQLVVDRNTQSVQIK